MKNILGLDIENMPFDDAGKLPMYISGNYFCTKVSIAGFECILMKPVGDMGTVESVKKHIAKVKEICGLPVAIQPDELSAFRRRSFLENRVPFVTEKQTFLPFLGTYLEKKDEKIEKVEAFTTSTQVALIKWLLAPEERIRVSDLMDGLGYTTMTESRVAKQLGATACFDVEKDGVANVLATKLAPKEVFDMLSPHMVSPVETSGYIDLPTEFDVTVAGIEALSERSMINPDNIHTYAMFGVDKGQLRKELVNPAEQAYAEIWKYDPKIFLWKDGFVDPISLALSLEGTGDERIEAAVTDMLDELWR